MYHDYNYPIKGTTDLQKKFHPYTISICSFETGDDFHFIFMAAKKILKEINNYDFKPDILIADGAEAITNGFMNAFDYKSIDDFTRVMCWAHVLRAVDVKAKPIEEKLRDQILLDIYAIQLSPSPEHFKIATDLFKKKWSARDSTIDTFVNYFESEWVNSRNNGWYEGFSTNIPSTDNGLESTNGKIKLIYTLRSRLSVNAYLTNLVNMLRHWSQDTLTEKIFITYVEFSENSWKLASLYLHSGTAVIKKIGSSDNFILFDKSDPYMNLDYIQSKLNKLQSNKDFDLDQLIACQSKFNKVSLDRKDWSSSRCTCSYFFKNYYCFHIIALAVNQKLLIMPPKYNPKVIAPKAKSGRPAKAKACLVKQ